MSEISTQVRVREQEFFDTEAAGLAPDDLTIPADQIERYRNARQSPFNIPKDTLFAYLRPLDGKQVLDYGCGLGENACLLAACGARVTAFDLSSGAIEKARERAQLHGVSDRIDFHVCSAGETNFASNRFDAIIGFAVLHHLHMALPAIYQEIHRLIKPEGVVYFIEPVANSRFFRWLRPLIPVRRYATPDERQLLYGDFQPLRGYFSDLQFEHYYFLERLERLTFHRGRTPLRWIDHQLQRLLPPIRRYYGDVLVTARGKK